MAATNIILGEGVFAINDTDVGLTRGGGQFTVEREYRQVEADGDYGPVKGRIYKARSTATLTMNLLEIVADDLSKLYPATQVTTSAGTTTFTGKEQVEAADYQSTVTWTGRTVDGREVVITLENAINLGNLDWTMTDKEEIVQQVTFTATYLPDARTTEPWRVEFADAGGGEGEEV